MDIDYIQPYCTLQRELDQAKNTLVTLNDNIRRIVGRDPKEVLRGDKYNDSKRSDFDRIGSNKDNGSLGYKRRHLDSKSVFNRLSAPVPRNVDEEFRPRLNSRVTRELPTRQEIVAAQCSDAEARARNRRMFGSLLGTLQKFCLEESRLKHKEDKKAQIEKKLEEQELQERQSLRRERESLFLDRKRKQLEIRKLELKMGRLKDFEVWESAQKCLKGHIKTKTKPHVYFKPRIMSKKTENLLSDSRNVLKKEMNQKREAINKEIAEIEDRFRLQEDEQSNNTNKTSAPHIHNNSLCEIVESKRVVQDTEEIINNNNNNSPPHNEASIEVKIKTETDGKENSTTSNDIQNESTISNSIAKISNGSPKVAPLLE